MRHLSTTRSLPVAAVALVLAACADGGDLVRPTVDVDTPPNALAAVTCTASLQSRTVSCGGGAGMTGGASGAVLIGGQDQYVALESSNIQILADTFAFDVTVQNLIPQPLGTTDFTTPHPTGVRVAFQNGPTSTSGGTITVANPDGTATFTAAGQPYFQYAGNLAADAISAPRQWKLQFSPEVTAFTFVLLVSAEVPYPDGYILNNPYVLTLDPNESRTLAGTVYSFVGNVLDEAITWNTASPLISVNGSQVTAGAARGFAELTPTSGPRPAGDYTTAVSVCQSTVVTSGHSSAQSIASSDCFSAFGSNQYRPSTSYYGDLYRVGLTAGQTVTITLDTGDDLDTYLVLADPLGLPVEVNDDDDEGVLGVGSRLVYTAEVTGVHVFEASTFSGLDQGAYTLSVTID